MPSGPLAVVQLTGKIKALANSLPTNIIAGHEHTGYIDLSKQLYLRKVFGQRGHLLF